MSHRDYKPLDQNPVREPDPLPEEPPDPMPNPIIHQESFTMTEDQKLLAMWAAINSALYLAAIIGVALVLGKPLAWQLAIFTYGVCYLSYAVQMWYPGTMIAKALTFLSIVTGTGAGLALLW